MDKRFKGQDAQVLDKHGHKLLVYFFQELLRASDKLVPYGKHQAVLECLLHHGADPNKAAMGQLRGWQTALSQLRDLSRSNVLRGSKFDYLIRLSKTLERLIEYGANPNATLPRAETHYNPCPYQETALAIIQFAFKDILVSIATRDMATTRPIEKRLTEMLVARGAKNRLWLRKELVHGPPEVNTTPRPKVKSRISFLNRLQSFRSRS